MLRSMFTFIRNWQTCFQSGCTILHSYQWYIRVSVAPLLGVGQSFWFWSFCLVCSGTMMLRTFSHAYWPIAYLLWRVCLHILSIFRLGCLFMIELLEFFIYIWISVLCQIGVFCRSLLPVCDLAIHFLNSVSDGISKFGQSHIYYFSYIIAFCDLRNLCPPWSHDDSLYFPLKALWF